MNEQLGARVKAYAACPDVDRIEKRSRDARRDAVQLVSAVRELDPREVWGTLALWTAEDPLRVYAAVVTLAAMVPDDRPVSELLEWTTRL